MFKKLSVSVLVMVMLLVMTVSTAFAATQTASPYQDSTGNVNITDATVPNSEVMFAGSNVIAANSVFDTTTFFAGNAITLDGVFNGDVFVAGNIVTVNGEINGNLYASGNQVTINGLVSGDAFAAGSDVTLSKSAVISRDLYAAASTVSIDGTVSRNLRVGASDLIISGAVNGFVQSDVKQLTIKDGAKITGPINNRSANEAVVSPNATAPAVTWDKVTQQQTEPEKQGPSVGSVILSIITQLAFILVIWLLITFLTKEFNENTTVMAKKHILASLGIGAGFMFVTPLLALLSFLIYVPFGFAMTCLIIASMILGMPVAAVVFSKLLTGYFNTKMKPLLSSFVSVLIIAAAIIIVGFIPILNMLVGLFLAVFGLGFIWYNIIFTNRKLKDEKAAAHELLLTNEITDESANTTVVPTDMTPEDKNADTNK